MNLHRYAIFLAVCALLAIASGAYITSLEVVARQPQSGSQGGAIDLTVHRALAIAAALLILGAALWTMRSTLALRALAWSAVVVVVVDMGLGWQGIPLSPGAGVFHALLAHLLFSLLIVMVVATSPQWTGPPETVDPGSRPWLRPVTVAIPPVVFLQITLGAAYRHDMTSIMPHIAVAMAVAFLALIGASAILQNFDRPAPMRAAAVALISIVLTQVCLGITAFILLVVNYTGTVWFVVSTVGHVSVGAATLAASVVMAMQVWRSVLPRARNQRTE